LVELERLCFLELLVEDEFSETLPSTVELSNESRQLIDGLDLLFQKFRLQEVTQLRISVSGRNSVKLQKSLGYTQRHSILLIYFCRYLNYVTYRYISRVRVDGNGNGKVPDSQFSQVPMQR